MSFSHGVKTKMCSNISEQDSGMAEGHTCFYSVQRRRYDMLNRSFTSCFEKKEGFCKNQQFRFNAFVDAVDNECIKYYTTFCSVSHKIRS